MSLTVLHPSDQLWYSAHQPINFGLNQPFYVQGYQTATDDGFGKTVFRLSGLVPYPFPEFTKKFWVEAGIYSGFHNVISYDAINFDIYTDTPFVGADPVFPALQRLFYCVIPFGYRLYYGYPSPTNFIDIKAFHKYDATAFVNVGELLKNTFSIFPPVTGFDENMYTYFQIDIIPLDETIDFLNLYSLTIPLFTGWIYTTEIYYALNSAIPHSRLQNLVANNKFIAEVEPIFFGDCCNVLTKIITNRAFNIFACPDGTPFGIGAMIVEETLQVG
jgi:hypothetical protein